MSRIIPLRAITDPTHIPTLVLVDMQKEYVASARALGCYSNRKTSTAPSMPAPAAS